jgi:hypothetical protein
MLPDFPDVKRRLVHLALFEFHQLVQQDGLIGAIKAMHYFEGRRFEAGDVDGYVDKFEPVLTSTPVELDRAALLEHGMPVFIESLRRAVEPQLKALHELLFQRATEAVDRVGNQIDAGGQPMSADLYLQMVEKVEIDFTEDGQPDISGVRIVTDPIQGEKLQRLMKEWAADPSFLKRYSEIMHKKRDEWRDRESNRKLVD